MHEYECLKRKVYNGGLTFLPVCPLCGRFVRCDDHVTVNGLDEVIGPNATCRRCGRVSMPCEGYIEQFAPKTETRP